MDQIVVFGLGPRPVTVCGFSAERHKAALREAKAAASFLGAAYTVAVFGIRAEKPFLKQKRVVQPDPAYVHRPFAEVEAELTALRGADNRREAAELLRRAELEGHPAHAYLAELAEQGCFVELADAYLDLATGSGNQTVNA